MPSYYAMDDCVDRELFRTVHDNCYESILTEESTQKIIAKIQELKEKQKERLKVVLNEKLKLENCTENDIREMQEHLMTADLQTLQYENATRIMECFVSANSFYKGRRTKRGLEKLIGWDKLYTINCKCGHRFVHHNGNHQEQGCGMGCDCKGFNSPKWEKELANISNPQSQTMLIPEPKSKKKKIEEPKESVEELFDSVELDQDDIDTAMAENNMNNDLVVEEEQFESDRPEAIKPEPQTLDCYC